MPIMLTDVPNAPGAFLSRKQNVTESGRSQPPVDLQAKSTRISRLGRCSKDVSPSLNLQRAGAFPRPMLLVNWKDPDHDWACCIGDQCANATCPSCSRIFPKHRKHWRAGGKFEDLSVT